MSSPIVEQLEDRVTALLVDLGLPPGPQGHGLFAFRHGRTVLLVSVFEAGGLGWVRVATPLLKDFRPNLELVTRILRMNTEVLLGGFLIFEDDTLTFSVTLAGEGLEERAFGLAVDHVARISSACGEELQAIAGGRLASELLSD